MPLESKVVAIRVNRVCVCVSLFCFYSFFLCAGKDVQVFRVFGRNPKLQNRHNFFFMGKQRTCREEREKEEQQWEDEERIQILNERKMRGRF